MQDTTEWIIGSKPRPYDDIHTFELWVRGEVRKAKRAGNRSLSLTPGQLYFVDCTRPEQNVICDESTIDAWRVIEP